MPFRSHFSGRMYVVLLCAALCAGLYAPLPYAAAQVEENATPDVLPERLYEAVSGYLEGMHGAKAPKTRDRNEKEKYRGARKPETASAEREPDLGREIMVTAQRIRKGEWDLAALSLERAASQSMFMAAADRERLAETQRGLETLSRDKEKAVGAGVMNSAGMRFVLVKPGDFTMGSSEADIRRIQSDWNVEEALLKPESPTHKVRITRPFLMDKYPVTIAAFKKFTSETGYRTIAEKQGWGWGYDESKKHWVKRSGASWRSPGSRSHDDYPVTFIAYPDAEAFCEWLSKREGRRYFLPTEAQWEYAARGGKTGKRYPWGDEYPEAKQLNSADRRSDLPWADRLLDDGFERTSPVGAYDPNGYLLYDMVGNVWQFCADYFDAKTYEEAGSFTSDPTGPHSGKKRVVRGGNWAFGAGIARNGFRFGVDPDFCADITGFRVASYPAAGETVQESALNINDPAGVEQLIEKVKELTAVGMRIEARRAVDNALKNAPSPGSGQFDTRLFLKNLLDAFIDLSRDKTLSRFHNSIGTELVRIPAGSFVMGSSETEISWAMATLAQGQPAQIENEFPFHKVRLTRPFYLATTEVTVAQFQKFVDETGYVTDGEDDKGGQVFNTRQRRFERKDGATWRNPGWTIAPEHPVVMVSYNDAQAFCEWLAAKEKLPYKLPTEAQWEYAARGGIAIAAFPWGDDLPDGKRANYADKNTDFEWRDRNADDGYKHTAPVGSYEPNGYGLYDMAGNALEWCRDYYGEDYYRYSPELDPEGPGHGENRVAKGGEWTFGPINLRCAFRGWSRPDLAFYNSGFRLSIEQSTTQREFYFSASFLSKQWVPGPDQRTVSMAQAKENERRAHSRPDSAAPQRSLPEEATVIKGLLIIDFSPKSDARKAGLAKGDIIIEYNGTRDLTSDKFIALTAGTKKDKMRPALVFARDGVEHFLRVPPGFLGVSVTETAIRGPLKRTEPKPEPQPEDRGGKQDWT